jgi:hypothetical protein
MSDTHAHTANVQAEVQTGKPHIPPGHVEADRPVDRLGDREMKSMAPYLTGGALILAVVVAVVLFLA